MELLTDGLLFKKDWPGLLGPVPSGNSLDDLRVGTRHDSSCMT